MLDNPEITVALKAHGFTLTHRGGGLYNYGRTHNGMEEIICSAQDGQPPLDFLETVELYRFPSNESPELPFATYERLQDWFDAQSTGDLSETQCRRIVAQLREVLWPGGVLDHEQDDETLERVLQAEHLRPAGGS